MTTVTVDASVNSGDDPCSHESFINLPDGTQLVISVSGSTVTITTPGDPWVMATGTVDASCNVTASGTGDIAGFAGTECVYNLMLAGGSITGATYECGVNDELPGCPSPESITYQVAAI